MTLSIRNNFPIKEATYLYYLRTQITKTTPFIVKAPVEPISVVAHISTSHVRRGCFNFLNYQFLEGFKSFGGNVFMSKV